MSHPLTLGIILFFQTICISLFIGIIAQSFWYSYILFLVFIGGLLIIFIYIISLLFNNKFNIKFNYINLIIIFIFLSLTIFFLLKIDIYWLINNNEIIEINFLKSLFLENSLRLNKLFNIPNIIINLLLINYLFLILRITIKITNFKIGPLRSK